MRTGTRQPTDSNYFNKEVALNELLGAFQSDDATVTSVADSDSNQTILSANSLRRGFIIYNDSTVTLYLKYGATATSTDFTIKLRPEGIHESSGYKGRLDGIWESNASGSARVTELL